MGTKFFEIFGRVALFAVLFGIVAGGAYYFGMQKDRGEEKEKDIIVAVNDTVSPTVQNPGTKPTKTPVTTVQINAGSAGHTKYTASVPTDWKSSKDEVNDSDQADTLTLTKNGYTVVIYQANMGGSLYSFADAKADGPFAQEYTGTYVDFTGAGGEKYRRIDSSSQSKPGEKNSTVLMKGSDTYQGPTTFGAISYITPLSPGPEILDQMDSIISSIKKQ